MRSITSVLRQPGFPQLMLAQFFIHGQVFLAIAILPLYTVALGGDALTAALHTALFTGMGVIFRFFFGRMGDVEGPRRPLLLGAIVFALTNVLFLLVDSLLWLAVARVIQAIGLAAYLSSYTALVLEITPQHSRGTALGLVRGVIALSILAFPSGAERLLQTTDFATFFIVATILGGVGVLLFWTSPALGSFPRPGRPATDRSAALPGYRTLLAAPGVVLALVAMATIAVTQIGTLTFLPIRLQALGQDFAPFFLAMGLTAFVSGLAGSYTDRYGPIRILLGGLLAAATGSAILMATIALPALLLSGALLGSAFTLGISAGMSWLAELVPENARATAMALCETSFDVAITGGSAALGVVAAAFGYPFVFFGLATLATVVAATFRQRVRRLSSQPMRNNVPSR